LENAKLEIGRLETKVQEVNVCLGISQKNLQEKSDVEKELFISQQKVNDLENQVTMLVADKAHQQQHMGDLE